MTNFEQLWFKHKGNHQLHEYLHDRVFKNMYASVSPRAMVVKIAAIMVDCGIIQLDATTDVQDIVRQHQYRETLHWSIGTDGAKWHFTTSIEFGDRHGENVLRAQQRLPLKHQMIYLTRMSEELLYNLRQLPTEVS